MIERWRHEEHEHREPFAGKAFVSIDPGACGWALGWVPDEPKPVGFCHALDPMALVELFALVGATVAVVEGQYIGMMNTANSILEMAQRQYMAIGWLAAAMHRDQAQVGARDLNLFQVSPSTWQAAQRRRAGIQGKLARKEGMDLTLAEAERLIGDQVEWTKARKPEREGLASALGIGIWWRGLGAALE